jgi:cytosine deaminase
MDPWYSMGSGDMLEVASMGLHVAQMTSREAIRYCYECVTSHPAKALGLEGYGVEKGCKADFVLLQARDTIEAIRLKATRLAVVKGGNVIATTLPRQTQLALEGRPGSVDPADYAPNEG